MWRGSAQSDVSFGTGPSGGGWKVRISLKVSPEQKDEVDQRETDRKIFLYELSGISYLLHIILTATITEAYNLRSKLLNKD